MCGPRDAEHSITKSHPVGDSPVREESCWAEKEEMRLGDKFHYLISFHSGLV